MKKLNFVAAAVLALSAIGAQASAPNVSVADFGAHDTVEVGVSLPISGAFIDYFLFTLTPAATVTSSAVSLSNLTFLNIAGGSYSLWSGDGIGAAVDTQVSANYSFDGFSGNTFNSQVLSTGSYFYKVTGTATGSAGGVYSLTSTLAPVPEPETYALMLAGLAAVGFMARRRKAA
jgi:hypothetical protein